MSRFSGPQGPGAQKRYKDVKRRDAEFRNNMYQLKKEKESAEKKRRNRDKAQARRKVEES